ncbi:hypothetical protein ACT2EB_18510 [Salmonella enterica subsp. enterica serovar Typhimurium]|uniref:hypothetical protein n=1 Tax=Salmonella enterica TaxID=28901 RepID=UPI0040278436
MILFKKHFGPFGSPSSPGRRLHFAGRPHTVARLRGATAGVSVLPDSKRCLNINCALAASVPDAPLPTAR